MYEKEELLRYNALYKNVDQVELESFLDKFDIETIIKEGHFQRHGRDTEAYMGIPVAYKNLRNQLVVPKNPLRHCTITFKRLHDGHEFGDWLNQIAKTLFYSEDTEVSIAFSFLCWNPRTAEQTYIFAAKELAPFRFNVDNSVELLSKFQVFGSMTDQELLNTTFVETHGDNPFANSGFCPQKLVCSYVYVTK